MNRYIVIDDLSYDEVRTFDFSDLTLAVEFALKNKGLQEKLLRDQVGAYYNGKVTGQ